MRAQAVRINSTLFDNEAGDSTRLKSLFRTMFSSRFQNTQLVLMELYCFHARIIRILMRMTRIFSARHTALSTILLTNNHKKTFRNWKFYIVCFQFPLSLFNRLKVCAVFIRLSIRKIYSTSFRNTSESGCHFSSIY